MPVDPGEKRDKTHETPFELLPSVNVARGLRALEYASPSESIFFSDELLIGIEEADKGQS